MIERFELPVDPTRPVPDVVLTFLRHVDERHELVVRAGHVSRLPAFATSDYPLVYLGLRALLHSGLVNERFLEWGEVVGGKGMSIVVRQEPNLRKSDVAKLFAKV